ncbi:MAG: ribonuclease E activity regulator RraA [Acinetobacter sp.]|mgnify:FL=1|uniref:ribonuclease E activity regulator RraA n=1 Tax=Acinetobacter TaxID=469 RepID=UPI0006AFD820|nr:MULTISPECIES: ribonuclease E activity regulator RraA [Acinetobacter]ALD03340.1 ribonuclease activity regulator protein RraA [Acinetobacter sp. TTH0-4]MBE9401688.1 ribonuclease E activity regulator RraA [Acinetobacter albensis]QPF37005.1 ribonuclease E activity regulator RraA [Acinetobacter sp. TTH0-4]
MSDQTFVTCDLLDDHPEKDLQVVTPSMDGKFFKSYGARQSFAGQVVTVKCFEDNSRVKELLATDGRGKVLVVDGGASMRCALMGDMIAESAVNHHWSGVVIYGCVRDVDAIAELDLGIHALAAIPQKSNRKGIGEVDLTLYFGGVSINSGDYIYADNNGIVIAKEKLVDL